MAVMTKQELIEKIIDLVRKHPKNYSQILMSKKNSDLMAELDKALLFLDSEKTLCKTKVYCLLNDVSELPRCKVCGKAIENLNNSGYFSETCSRACQAKNDETNKKREQTNLERYGHKSASMNESIKEKAKATILKRYGTTGVQSNKSVKEKTEKTVLDRYGVKHVFELEETKEKAKKARETNAKQISDKIKQTCLKKYGVDNCAKADDIKRRIRMTKLESAYKKLMRDPLVKPLFSLDEFIDAPDVEHKWECKKCGRTFSAEIDKNWYSQGIYRSYVRCYKCFPRMSSTSHAEKEVFKYVQSLLPDVEIRANDRNIIGPKELDIYIPSMKLAIEYDGLYRHSENAGKTSTFHLHKTEECAKKGIRLIHIFEDEWLYKQNIVKNRLACILGKYERKIGARQCKIKSVTTKATEEFLNANHIQGSCRSSVRLGLYHKDKLVALMTFGRSRYSSKYEWELLRYCTYKSWHILGGAGKLFSHFIKDYKPNSVVSYCDLRWSQGGLYEKLGFVLDHQSKPNYWYFKNSKKDYYRIHRSMLMKHKLKNLLENFDSKLSESENLFNNNYCKIYDCGNLVFGFKV